MKDIKKEIIEKLTQMIIDFVFSKGVVISIEEYRYIRGKFVELEKATEDRVNKEWEEKLKSEGHCPKCGREMIVLEKWYLCELCWIKIKKLTKVNN
jgi:hypothetical protein